VATAADVEAMRTLNDTLTARATAALAAFWDTLDLSSPVGARNALLEFMPALTDQYGEAAAILAADWYDALRGSEGVPGVYVATLAATVPEEVVVTRTRFGAGHLWTDNPSQALTFLLGVAQEYVLQPGRDTITQAAMADPAAYGWHRETRGSRSFPSGCKFCQMLAGRGDVYKQATAKFAAHNDCRCVAVPSWDANAREVSADAYVASERLESLRRQAAGEPVTLTTRRRRYLERRGITAQEDAQQQLEEHRKRVREWIDN